MSHREHLREPGQAARHGRKALHIAGLVLGGVALAVLFAFLFGLVVQALWNWLMPGLFGFKTITYWQAFGLVLLAKLLFGSHGQVHKRHHDRFERHVHSRFGKCRGEADGPAGIDGVPGNGKHWRHFREYWQSEGRAAFDAYLQEKESREADPTPSK
ncbi:MAG: hypothetical protein NTZ26_14805 [Candidatus Aminicenantes bacterium]|nr:hypothetical protein [Candidatus Aminicenantes bacterium]